MTALPSQHGSVLLDLTVSFVHFGVFVTFRISNPDSQPIV